MTTKIGSNVMFKALGQDGKSSHGFQYNLPPKPGSWKRTKLADPAEPDGAPCGEGRLHLHKHPSTLYTPPGTPVLYFARGVGPVIGEDEEKATYGAVDLRMATIEEIGEWAREREDGLSWCELNHVHWDGINLEGARLYRAELCEASLVGAVFDKANASGVRFARANLTNASFMETDASGASFSSAMMLGISAQDADFSGAYLSGASLRNANFTQAAFRYASFYHAYASGVTFSHTDMSHASFVGSAIKDCSFFNANLKGAKLEDVTFVRVVFAGADLTGARLHRSVFQDCEISPDTKITTSQKNQLAYHNL